MRLELYRKKIEYDNIVRKELFKNLQAVGNL